MVSVSHPTETLFLSFDAGRMQIQDAASLLMLGLSMFPRAFLKPLLSASLPVGARNSFISCANERTRSNPFTLFPSLDPAPNVASVSSKLVWDLPRFGFLRDFDKGAVVWRFAPPRPNSAENGP